MRGMTTADLIARIEAFAAKHGIAPATVTSRAVSNSRLYARMKAGGACTLTSAERLVAYMAAEDAKKTTPEEDAA
jgi:hypothetical protein